MNGKGRTLDTQNHGLDHGFAFDGGGPTAPGITRKWTRLQDYSDEVSNARTYAGFHSRFSTDVGYGKEDRRTDGGYAVGWLCCRRAVETLTANELAARVHTQCQAGAVCKPFALAATTLITWIMSPIGRYCCKSRKSNDAKNLAKVEF
jgi:hypothetical protein